MGSWPIYSKDGNITKCILKQVEYNGVFMGERTVSATLESSTPIDFSIYDYIIYRGEKFELDYEPTHTKIANRESTGNAFTYDLLFVSLKYELERCQMRDIVPGDNGIVYPSPLAIEFTGTASKLAEKIQACLDQLYTGSKKWTITVLEGSSEEEKNLSINQANCWDAISLFNSEYGLNFYISNRTVTVGNAAQAINFIFQYGKGKGLYSIERTADTSSGVVTRLLAYGGTNNLGSNYLKDKNKWPNSVIPASMYLPNLMLPGFETSRIDYIESDNITEYGIREGVIVYEDIYPSIAGMTNSKGERIDKLKNAEVITDETKSTFTVTTYDLEFENELQTYILDTDTPRIAMKSGSLQGYSFEINTDKIAKQSDGGYQITLTRNTDNGYTVPNKDINLSSGDEFVFLGIEMPKAYIESAEERLLSRAQEYLAKYSKTNFGYDIGLDEIFVVRNQAIYETLYEGKELHVKDDDISIDELITIQNLTIQEGESYLPNFKITLNNEVSASTLNRIQGQVSQLENTVTNGFSLMKWQYGQALSNALKPYRLWSQDKTTVVVEVNENAESVKLYGHLLVDKDVVAYSTGEATAGIPIGSTKTLGIFGLKPDGGLEVDENGYISVVGGSSGGGIESIVSSGSGNAVTAMTYNPDTKIITYTKGNTFALSSQIPTNTNQLTNGAGFIRDGNGMFTTLSGSGSASKYLAGNGTFYTISHNEISGLPDYYVTLSTAQTISGAKTFTKDIVSYGDVIAYASGTVTPSIPIASSTSYGIVKYDNSTIKVNASGQLYVASGGSGGGSVAWGDITGKPSWIGSSKPSYSWGEITSKPSWIGASKPSYAWSEISSKPSGLVTSVSVSGSGNALGSASFSGGTLYLSYTNISGGGSWTGGTITSTIRKDSTNQGFYLGAVSGGWALGCSTSEAWLQAYGSAQTAFYCGGIKQVYIDKTSWTRSAWIVSSDMREKIRLSDFTDILDKVKGIDVFRYRRKDNDGKIYTGVSAQQLLGLLPDFVSYDKTTERYGVTYDVLGACVAIQGIKELYTKHKELDNYVRCRKHWETTKDYEIYQLLKVVKEQSMRIEDLERRVA